jgi:hypothetical protein
LVGVFMPYIKGWRRWHFGVAAFVAFILIGLSGSVTAGNEAGQAYKGGDTEKASSANTSSDATTPVESSTSATPENDWSYSQDKDQMRGGTTYYAQLESTNSIHLDFPYGDQKGKILVRKSPQFGFDVLVGVDSGQILCNSFSNSHVNVKFDDGPIKRYGCTDASDGSDNMVFIQGASGFLSNLKKSRKTVIEAEFFQNGMQQMTFDTAGLKWEH